MSSLLHTLTSYPELAQPTPEEKAAAFRKEEEKRAAKEKADKEAADKKAAEAKKVSMRLHLVERMNVANGRFQGPMHSANFMPASDIDSIPPHLVLTSIMIHWTIAHCLKSQLHRRACRCEFACRACKLQRCCNVAASIVGRTDMCLA